MKNGQNRTFPLSDIAVDVFNHTLRSREQIVFKGSHNDKPILGLRQINLKGEDVDNGGFLQNRQPYSALSNFSEIHPSPRDSLFAAKSASAKSRLRERDGLDMGTP